MEDAHYYHLFADGDKSPDFIICENDFEAAFNRVGLCAAHSPVIILAFNIEETHPHFLMHGSYRDCVAFGEMYNRSTVGYMKAQGRKKICRLSFNIYQVTDKQYLMNLAAYVIIQPTKDGKGIMPYDYKWGSAPLYFRGKNAVMPWRINHDGSVSNIITAGELGLRQTRKLLHSKLSVPGGWRICNGLILPDSYIAVKRFERIFGTHNCYRTFQSGGRSSENGIKQKMSSVTGLTISDIDARAIGEKVCAEMFKINSAADLNPYQRLRFAQRLRREYKLSPRQLSAICLMEESDIRKYA